MKRAILTALILASCQPSGGGVASDDAAASSEWEHRRWVCDPHALAGCQDRVWTGQCEAAVIQVPYTECVAVDGRWAVYNWTAGPVANDCELGARILSGWELLADARDLEGCE